MGKNLRGKEIGKGIAKKKDGTYVSRFVNISVESELKNALRLCRRQEIGLMMPDIKTITLMLYFYPIPLWTNGSNTGSKTLQVTSHLTRLGITVTAICVMQALSLAD